MNNNFAKTLKELRLKAGHTEKQVYQKLNIPQSTFCSWKIGKAEPSACSNDRISSQTSFLVSYITQITAQKQKNLEKSRFF